jgi:hypothetical protein
MVYGENRLLTRPKGRNCAVDSAKAREFRGAVVNTRVTYNSAVIVLLRSILRHPFVQPMTSRSPILPLLLGRFFSQEVGSPGVNGRSCCGTHFLPIYSKADHFVVRKIITWFDLYPRSAILPAVPLTSTMIS